MCARPTALPFRAYVKRQRLPSPLQFSDAIKQSLVRRLFSAAMHVSFPSEGGRIACTTHRSKRKATEGFESSDTLAKGMRL